MKILDKPIRFLDEKLRHFDPVWQSENGTGGLRIRYNDKTGVAKYREWRGMRDTMLDYAYWLKTWGALSLMIVQAPVKIVKALLEYRWFGSYLGAFMMLDRLMEGLRGEELKVSHMQMHTVVSSMTQKLGFLLKNDERFGGGPDTQNIIQYTETIGPLWLTGFKGLYPLPLQTYSEFFVSYIDQHVLPYYIDVAESFGLPADACALCASETGLTFDDALPSAGKVLITSNMTCNASESKNMFERARAGKPDFAVAMAMLHNDPEGHTYSRKNLEEGIAFIEEHYGVKYDWDEFFKHAEWMNEQNTIEIEKWDYFRTEHSPLNGAFEIIYRMYEWQAVNGTDYKCNKNDRKVIERMRRCYESKYIPFDGKYRHRAILWGPAACYYADLPTWLRNCWGIRVIFGLECSMGHNMINTEDPDLAMDDLAIFTEKNVMRNVGTGGWETQKSMFEWGKLFNCDMYMIYDNIACKGMNGFHGLMEECATAMGFKVVFVPNDLHDSRTVTRQDIRTHINTYMTVVMGEEPLDTTLLEFDDSEAY